MRRLTMMSGTDLLESPILIARAKLKKLSFFTKLRLLFSSHVEQDLIEARVQRALEEATTLWEKELKLLVEKKDQERYNLVLEHETTVKDLKKHTARLEDTLRVDFELKCSKLSMKEKNVDKLYLHCLNLEKNYMENLSVLTLIQQRVKAVEEHGHTIHRLGQEIEQAYLEVQEKHKEAQAKVDETFTKYASTKEISELSTVTVRSEKVVTPPG
jgi:hypothetical protein